MNISRLTELHCGIWLVDPITLANFARKAFQANFGGATESNTKTYNGQAMPDQNKTQFRLDGSTAVISVNGVLWNNFSDKLYDPGYDVTSTNVLARIVKAIGEDSEIDSLVMIYDSPGGYSMGVPECAAEIAKTNSVKPVYSYIAGMCCSGAAWLASQSYSINATQSAVTGSIGAYMAQFNVTRMFENMGIKVELFRSGPHKGMGLMGTDLTDEQRGMLQAGVDKVANSFKTAVRSGRAPFVIGEEFMQGQSLDIDEAIACGLVDQVSTLDEAIRDAAILGKQKRLA